MVVVDGVVVVSMEISVGATLVVPRGLSFLLSFMLVLLLFWLLLLLQLLSLVLSVWLFLLRLQRMVEVALKGVRNTCFGGDISSHAVRQEILQGVRV